MSDGIPVNVGSVGKGVLVVLGLTVGGLFLGFALLGSIGVFVLGGIGVVQAAWIVPLWLYLRRLGETETAKGILIMASIVFLLNAGCWGLVGTLFLHTK